MGIEFFYGTYPYLSLLILLYPKISSGANSQMHLPRLGLPLAARPGDLAFGSCFSGLPWPTFGYTEVASGWFPAAVSSDMAR